MEIFFIAISVIAVLFIVVVAWLLFTYEEVRAWAVKILEAIWDGICNICDAIENIIGTIFDIFFW